MRQWFCGCCLKGGSCHKKCCDVDDDDGDKDGLEGGDDNN